MQDDLTLDSSPSEYSDDSSIDQMLRNPKSGFILPHGRLSSWGSARGGGTSHSRFASTKEDGTVNGCEGVPVDPESEESARCCVDISNIPASVDPDRGLTGALPLSLASI
jgi:hypothetical protein